VTAARRGPRSPSLELAEAMRAALESVGAVFGAQLAEIGRVLANVRLDPAGAAELEQLGELIGAALEWGTARAERGDPTGDPPLDVFWCPKCGRTSANPDDAREGYCGACHDWTGQPRAVLS
jgi:hypothetical protein